MSNDVQNLSKKPGIVEFLNNNIPQKYSPFLSLSPTSEDTDKFIFDKNQFSDLTRYNDLPAKTLLPQRVQDFISEARLIDENGNPKSEFQSLNQEQLIEKIREQSVLVHDFVRDFMTYEKPKKNPDNTDNDKSRDLVTIMKTGTGDCDDYAHVETSLLQYIGVPKDILFLMQGYSIYDNPKMNALSGGGHAISGINFPNGEIIILDMNLKNPAHILSPKNDGRTNDPLYKEFGHLLAEKINETTENKDRNLRSEFTQSSTNSAPEERLPFFAIEDTASGKRSYHMPLSTILLGKEMNVFTVNSHPANNSKTPPAQQWQNIPLPPLKLPLDNKTPLHI